MAHLGLTPDQELQVVFAEQQFVMHRTWWENGREGWVLLRMQAFYDALNITRHQAQQLAEAAYAENEGWSMLYSDLPEEAYDQVLHLIFGTLP